MEERLEEEEKDMMELRLDVPRTESTSWGESRKIDFASDADENGSHETSSELQNFLFQPNIL